MKNVLEIVQLSTQHLQQKGFQNARRQAEEVIADALEIKRLELYLQFDRPLNNDELELCRTHLTRRARGEPAQYIRGHVEFLDCLIKVTPAALIPRQETEILADKIAKELSLCDLENKTLWDVCCGSGCIGIALKKKFPQLNVVLSDLSKEALQLSRENAQKNEVDVTFLEGDLLTPFIGKQANFIVCNPPYIAEKEFMNLEIEVRYYEPKMALISGPTGLEFYKRLSLELPKFLASKGKVWLEMGTGQGQRIKDLFEGGSWTMCRYENDWSGHDRFFFLEIE